MQTIQQHHEFLANMTTKQKIVYAMQEGILEIKRLEAMMRRQTASGPCTIQRLEDAVKLLEDFEDDCREKGYEWGYIRAEDNILHGH